MGLPYTDAEIAGMYVTARNRNDQIGIIAQLAGTNTEKIIEILRRTGVLHEEDVAGRGLCKRCGTPLRRKSKTGYCTLCQYAGYPRKHKERGE